MWHRRRTNLALLETFGNGFSAGHQTDGMGQRRWASAQLNQCRYGIEIEGTWVNLTNGIENTIKAQVCCNAGFQLGQTRFIAIHEIQHVLCGTHRPLDAAQWVAAQQFAHALQSHQHLICCGSKTLTQGGGLSSHVVGTASHNQALILRCAGTNRCNNSNALVAHKLQRTVDLQLLHVFGEVTRSHALVDMLMSSQRIEFLNAGLHIMAGNALALSNAGQINLINDSFIGCDCLIGDCYPQIFLRFHHGDPELALHDDLFFGTPQVGKLCGGVTV